jgi:hypothetical protein
MVFMSFYIKSVCLYEPQELEIVTINDNIQNIPSIQYKFILYRGYILDIIINTDRISSSCV